MKNKTLSTCMAAIAGTIILFGALATAQAQSGGTGAWGHPCILLAPGDRPAVLARIKTSPQAAQAVALLQQQVTGAVKAYAANPDAALATIPALGGAAFDQARFQKHTTILSTVADAAILHFATGDAASGQYAADYLNFYLTRLAAKTPDTASVSGGAQPDKRGIFPKIALAYDFLQPFLTKPGTLVYDPVTRKRVPFDNAVAQKALINIARYGLKLNGPPDKHGRVANLAIMQGNGILYPILCIDDRAERERLFDVFWDKGTAEQPSLKNSILPMMRGQGIWPESTEYGGVNPIGFFDVIDRYKPELKIIENNIPILEGAFLRVQLNSPNGIDIRYGDSKRVVGGLDSVPSAFYLAHKKGLTDVQRKAEEVIKGYQKDKNLTAWTPGVGPTGGSYTYSPPIALFRDPIPYDPAVTGKLSFARTVLIKHAGIAIVRNWVDDNNLLYGLNGYIGGAHYTHSHCTGIDMELYGAGLFMGPTPGMPSPAQRGELVHSNYRRIYAGNNTVIVNGTSHGRQEGSWRGNSYLWQNNAINVACEPAHLAPPVSSDFGFATQQLKDTVNECLQQRTFSIIRTGPKTGYYLDIFRSRANKENRFHDYIYHNLGDDTVMTDDNAAPLKLAPTSKYNNDIGDPVHSPGWRFFEDARSTTALTGAVRVRFDLSTAKRAMNVFLPGGVAREYTTAVGPPTLEAENGYDLKKTRVLVIRQAGEAWNRPFVAVYEPTSGGSPSVSSVKQILQNGAPVAIEIMSVVDGTTCTDLVIANAAANAPVSLPDKGIEFQGRFAIVRTEHRDGKEQVSLYIGEGSRLRFDTHELTGGQKQCGYEKFER